MDPILRLQDISKSFGQVHALRGVDLTLYPGEVHGLIGENGAGKSTLMKVLSGVHQPDTGTMEMDGQPFRPASPIDARRRGIAMIYQELNLAPHLTVEENVMLGAEVRSGGIVRSSRERVTEVLKTLGHEDIQPDVAVSRLGISSRQIVEIARALATNARVVVMDEPTSSLTAHDTEVLFRVIRTLKHRGVAVVYISHFLEEVKQICDRYTVLRDGEAVATDMVGDTPLRTFIRYMLGRTVSELYPGPGPEPKEIVFEATQISAAGVAPRDVSLALRRGEILGVFGLVGAGRSELVRAIFGLEKASGGTLQLAGQRAISVTWLDPPRSLALGMNLLSEDRKSEGLAGTLSVLQNLTLSRLKEYGRLGILNLRDERRNGAKWLDRLSLTYHDLAQPADTLSGGNQQKLCLARMLHQDSDILFLDEPTRGVDVGSKAEIYNLIRQLATDGKAIVMISSYLPELLGMCHSIAVMHRGRLSAPKAVNECTESDIMEVATAGEANG